MTLRIGTFELPTFNFTQQYGGAKIRKRQFTPTELSTVIYVMLEIPDHYQKDINRLIKEFRQRYGIKFSQSYDFSKPNPKHITISQADLTLTNRHLKQLTHRWNRPLTMKDLYRDQITPHHPQKLWEKLTIHIQSELTDLLTLILMDQFEQLPEDTTASCYPSRFNIYGKFAVIQYKPDLGFHALLIPAIREALEVFFQGQGYLKMGKFYRDPRNIMLHISIAKEDPRYLHPPSPKIVQKIQSEHRINRIQPGLARNFVISHRILRSFKNPVWVSVGSFPRFN